MLIMYSFTLRATFSSPKIARFNSHFTLGRLSINNETKYTSGIFLVFYYYYIDFSCVLVSSLMGD